MQDLNGPVSIASFSGSVALVVDDSTDPAAQTGVSISGTQITGLAPTPINYAAATLSSLVIYGGAHGNTFTVSNTGSGYTTTLNSGTAADTVYVQATTGALNIHGQNGADTVMLGNTGTLGASPGNVQALSGAVTVDNASGSTALTVDDSSDATGRNVTLTNSQISGLAPANVNYANLSSLDIEGGSGADTFNVNSTANTSTTVNAGAGADQFFIAGGSLAGANQFNGQADDDVFNVNGPLSAPASIDGGGQTTADVLNYDAGGQSVVLTANSITAGAGQTLTFSNIEDVNLTNVTDVTVNGDGSSNTLTLTRTRRRDRRLYARRRPARHAAQRRRFVRLQRPGGRRSHADQ